MILNIMSFRAVWPTERDLSLRGAQRRGNPPTIPGGSLGRNCQFISSFLFTWRKKCCTIVQQNIYGGDGVGCLKCGRDVEDGQVFCNFCLEDMANCPVKPGTPISLPKPRVDAPPRKSSRAKLPPPPEEQVKRLRKRCRWLTALIVLLLAGCIALGAFNLRQLRQARKPQRGQNYSTMETTEG